MKMLLGFFFNMKMLQSHSRLIIALGCGSIQIIILIWSKSDQIFDKVHSVIIENNVSR